MDHELELRFLKVLKEMGIVPLDHSCGEQPEYDEGLDCLIDMFWKLK